MIALYPVLPVALFLSVSFEEFKKSFMGAGGLAWQQNCPGKVFFERPKSFYASFFWECYLVQSIYIYNFLMLGTNKLAVSHTLLDTVLTKEFWRKHMAAAGAFVPPQLAHWDGTNTTFSDDTQQKSRAIIKVNDGFLGGGDKILKDFELGSEEGK